LSLSEEIKDLKFSVFLIGRQRIHSQVNFEVEINVHTYILQQQS